LLQGKDESCRKAESYSSSLTSIKFLFHRILWVIPKLAHWYNKVKDSGFRSFNSISATIHTHYREILNFFDQRSTNVSAESFNAKLKAFRAALRGVSNIKYFLFRVAKIYA
jgi:transposase